jgi:hypothetical protein
MQEKTDEELMVLYKEYLRRLGDVKVELSRRNIRYWREL